MAQIFPSLIAANVLCLKKVISACDPYVAGYHIDVMDFHFVPNLTWGPDMINAIDQATNKPLMVHLMVDYPEKYLDRFHLSPETIISIHAESPTKSSISDVLCTIKAHGWTPSIALNPETPISILDTIDTQVNHAILMSVNPGFSGQEFMPIVYEKIKDFLNQEQDYTIAIDGGINSHNAHQLLEQGANQLAIGSAIFAAKDPLKELIKFSSI